MKKTIVLLLLIAVLAVAGCTEEQENPQNSVSLAGAAETVQQDSNDGVQSVQIVGPVTYRQDTYWQWHNQTTEILESKVGTNVKIYSYGLQYKGKLIEVDGFYAVLYDNVAGEIYVSIDTISAIGA